MSDKTTRMMGAERNGGLVYEVLLVDTGTLTPEGQPIYRLGVDNLVKPATVAPVDQASTDVYTLVAGSQLDALNHLVVSYTVKNTHAANGITYKVMGGNLADMSDAVQVQAPAALAALAYGSFSTAGAVWRYYGIYIVSTVGATPGTAQVRGLTKG
jgi:hypothetical protein